MENQSSNTKKNFQNTNSSKHTHTKGDDTMAASARNYVYEIKVDKNKQVEEPTITKELLNLCKTVAKKYPEKNAFIKQK